MKMRIAWSYLSSRKNNLALFCQRSTWVAAFFAVSLSSSAAPLVGGFGMGGSVTISLTTVDWSSNGPPTGTFITQSPATGDFVGLFGGNPPFYTGTVKDLFAPPVPVPRFLDLFTAPGYGGLSFDLSSVIAPVAPPCSTVVNPAVNQDCSLGAFTLRNTAGGGVSIDFEVLGFFQNGLDLTSRAQGRGLYTAQLVNNSVLNVVTTIAGGGSISSAYSADFVSGSTPAETPTPTNTPTISPTNTPTRTPTPTAPKLTALSPAKVWIGLASSDAVGLRLDLLGEVFVNSTKVAQGKLDNVGTGSSGFGNAILDSIGFDPFSPATVNPGDTLSLRVSARRTCSGGGHNSGTPRLWYNGQPIDSGSARDAGSRFDATIGSDTKDYFLRSGFALSPTAGTSRTFIGVFVNSSAPCPARPFTSFGTWSLTL